MPLMRHSHDIFHHLIDPLLEKLYGQRVRRGWDDQWDTAGLKLVCNDMFVLKYDASIVDKGITLNHLDIHRDATLFSFVIALNDGYKGGGTKFEHFNMDVVKLPAGFLSLHPGYVAHSGCRVTGGGPRYILAGFAEIESSISPSRAKAVAKQDMLEAKKLRQTRSGIEKGDAKSGFRRPESDVMLARLMLHRQAHASVGLPH